MEKWLNDKKIVVIGGTSGIGLSATRAFVAQGAAVVAVGLEPIVNPDPEGRVHWLVGDAREESTARIAVKICQEQFGGFDGLYHVAGGSGRRFGDGPLHEMTPEAWEQTFQLNLTSLMYSNRAAVKALMDMGRGGSILNLSTALAYAPAPDYFTTHAYAAAKAAVIGFVKSTASYYARLNIRINAIAPGLVETPMSQRAMGNEAILRYVSARQPLDGGRPGQPEDLDGAAVYFMADASRFTTGQILAVDGGWGVSEGRL